MATNSLIIISANTIILILKALKPIALNILYIYASYLHFPIVYKNKNSTANELIITVIKITYPSKYLYIKLKVSEIS